MIPAREFFLKLNYREGQAMKLSGRRGRAWKFSFWDADAVGI
jgi:hypothetical protein